MLKSSSWNWRMVTYHTFDNNLKIRSSFPKLFEGKLSELLWVKYLPQIFFFIGRNLGMNELMSFGVTLGLKQLSMSPWVSGKPGGSCIKYIWRKVFRFVWRKIPLSNIFLIVRTWGMNLLCFSSETALSGYQGIRSAWRVYPYAGGD